MRGENFEREIREQPVVWRNIAASSRAQTLAGALRGRSVLFLGSGSSLFMAELGALALRKRGIHAHALASTEAPFDHAAYASCVVVAISQSGRSTDLLRALDTLAPRDLVALTNTQASPLGDRAGVVVDVGAGPERAVPASKSVSATAAVLLWAASLLDPTPSRTARDLDDVAQSVGEWLDSRDDSAMNAARAIAQRRSAIVLGTGYGLPVAREFALKMKEASYLHAEGFSAGEFRHGSATIVDEQYALVGVADEASRAVVQRPLRSAAQTGCLRYSVGVELDGVARLGPRAQGEFAVLAWLVAAQTIALETGRALGVDGDVPRGQSKVLES